MLIDILHPARLLAKCIKKNNMEGCVYNTDFLMMNIRCSKRAEDKKS